MKKTFRLKQSRGYLDQSRIYQHFINNKYLNLIQLFSFNIQVVKEICKVIDSLAGY